jgi:hypothetical protein
MLGAASWRGKGFLRLRFLLLALALACLVQAGPAQAGTPAAAASSLGVAEPSAPEYRTNGKIFAFDPGRGAYTCSGTALDTPSGSIVLTAGHCVFEGGRWGRRIAFVPAYDHGARPFGTFAATAVYTMPQWRRSENPDFDVAAIEVGPSRLGTLGDVVGGRGWTTGRSRFSSFQIFGYPGGAQQGEALRSCAAEGLGSDRLTFTLPGPPAMPGRCDMARGSSGGGWLVEGLLDGVTSYGYPLSRGRLFSPYFGAAVGNFLAGLP